MKMKTVFLKIITLGSILLFFTASFSPVLATTSRHGNAQGSPFFDQEITFLMRLAGFSALSACIIQDDQIIWSDGYGYYDRDNHTLATSDTIYILASITKTIVGTALMQLYDQGLFTLDDDVNTILPFELRNPNFPDDPITVRMLLSHTSSLNTNNQLQYYWMNFSGDPPFEFFPEPYLREFLLPGGAYYDASVWSDTYHPGEQAMYANIGFDLISYLIELLSGEPFLDYCDTHIFAPLEMDNTSFNLSHLDINQVAIPYQRYFGIYHQINDISLLGENAPPDKYWRPRFYPAGGLYSTVEDLSHFLIAHMNQGLYKDVQLLKPETVTLMHTIAPDNAIGYGLAWMQTNIGSRLTTTGHAGDLPGADTWMLYNETQNLGVIYFANGNAAYSLIPLRGFILVQLLLYSLFTKQMTLAERPPMEQPYVRFFTKSVLTPQLLLN
jgi:CubicO group peptidase (beta-lactamase class C family)